LGIGKDVISGSVLEHVVPGLPVLIFWNLVTFAVGIKEIGSFGLILVDLALFEIE